MMFFKNLRGEINHMDPIEMFLSARKPRALKGELRIPQYKNPYQPANFVE